MHDLHMVSASTTQSALYFRAKSLVRQLASFLRMSPQSTITNTYNARLMRYCPCPWCEVCQEDMLSQSMVWIPGWAGILLSVIRNFIVCKGGFLARFPGSVTSSCMARCNGLPFKNANQLGSRYCAYHQIIVWYRLMMFDKCLMCLFSQEQSPAYRFSATLWVFSGLNNTLIKGWQVEKVPQQAAQDFGSVGWQNQRHGKWCCQLVTSALTPSCLAIFWVCVSLLEIHFGLFGKSVMFLWCNWEKYCEGRRGGRKQHAMCT